MEEIDSEKIFDYLIDNFKNWTSGNKQIDYFIGEKQLLTMPDDIVFEWIPYGQFNDIKEIGNGVATAVWEDGPLYCGIWIRKSNKEVFLKCLCNVSLSDQFFDYLDKVIPKGIIYGISQNPDTKDYVIVFREEYFEIYCKKCDWTSGDKQIDAFIQEKQSQIDSPWKIVFEWIPYNQFYGIEEIGNGNTTAIWKGGPLKFNEDSKKYERNLINKKVALKYLYNLQYILSIDKFSKVISKNFCYGMSQNPDTKYYILVFHEKYFEKISKKYRENHGKKYTNEQYKWHSQRRSGSNFMNRTCESKRIDAFNQEEQFKSAKDIENISTTEICKNGPLKCNASSNKYERNLNEKIASKFYHNFQNTFDEVLTKAKLYALYTSDPNEFLNKNIPYII
uniref:Protein kinase domain-containing protein n=1 Tax=Rhizophagus irregularis (strain DAOM 181602 / DAOM 197198 / MUCL 43194) TaxID=747089 RepID=U9V691_RHIID